MSTERHRSRWRGPARRWPVLALGTAFWWGLLGADPGLAQPELEAPAAAIESAAQPEAATPADASPAFLFAADRAREIVPVSGDRVCLANSHVDPASIAVHLGKTELIAGRDFMVDADPGCLRFADGRRFLGAELTVEYRFFPFPLAERYYHRAPGAIAAAVSAADSIASPADTSLTVIPRRMSGGPLALDGPGGSNGNGAGRLAIRGNKTFAVHFGNAQDAALSQSLDLEVSGQVATGVELRAILSDRDLPLQPAGNTETIDEIDKVLVEIKSRNLAATLGDYDVQAYGGSFLQYGKRLEGVKAEGAGGGREFVLAAAVAKGRFLSLEIPGTEGKQGPYELTDDAGNRDITVIAGSETVWINGERLTRGEHDDYTIDYSRAEVTFTSRLPIRSDARITVDYEYASSAFKRNFYVGGGKANVGDGKLALGLSVISEADDAGDPVSGLSDQERALLAGAGDTLRATARDAGVFVGPGQGEYLAIGGEVIARFQYAGTGQGDYDVGFVEVGAGAGDYGDSLTAGGRQVYRYLGAGQGNFLPGRVLAPPTAQRLMDLTGKSQLREDLAIEGELALSGFDQNTLSSLDDLDNGDSAQELRVRYSPTVGLGGRAVGLALTGGYRDLGQDFRTVGRVRPADYDYQWNAPAGAFDAGESRKDLGLEVTPATGLALRTNLATTSSDIFQGRRTAYGLTLSRRIAGRFLLERVQGEAEPVIESAGTAKGVEDRDRAFESGELSTTFGRWRPRVTYAREQRIDRSAAVRRGQAYLELGAGADVDLPARARFGLEFRRRNDDELGTGRPWTDIRHALEQTYRLDLPRAGAVSMDASFTRRTTDETVTASRQVVDLAKVDVLHSSLRGGFESDTHYDVTTTDVARQGQELVFVGEGQGAYDAFGRYVGTGGDYTLRRTDGATASDLRTRLRLSTRWTLEPRRFLGSPAQNQGFKRVASALGFETTIDADELTRLPLASPRLFFNPNNYQRDDATFRGLASFRQDVDVLEGNRWASFRLRGERRSEADNRVLGVARDLGTRSQGVRLRSAPWAPLATELEVAWGQTESTEEATGPGGAPAVTTGYEIDNRSTALDFTGRPGGDLRLGFLLRRATDREAALGAEALTLELSPSFTTHWHRARLDGRYRRVSESRTGFFPASYRVGVVPGTRHEYDLSLEYRAGDHVTISGGVAGQRPPALDFIDTGRMEVRAYF